MSTSETPASVIEISPQLAAWLRWAAVRSAEITGGGCALVFVTQRDQPMTLRAAAGFREATDAREAAAEVLPHLLQSEGLESAGLPKPSAGAQESLVRPVPTPLAMGARGAAGALVIALRFEERVHGVLVVAAPAAMDARVQQSLLQAAGSVAIHLDHAHLAREVERLRQAANLPRETPPLPEVDAIAEVTPEADPISAPTPARESIAVEADPDPHLESNADSDGDGDSDELLKLSEALFAQDIELRRSREKLGKVEKLKNDFIEKMSRELRTPLNSIIESIIGVLAGENDRLSDPAKTSLRTALDEGTAFQRTLQNILDLWRIKQRELATEIQEVNIAELIDETIFSVQDTLGDKPVQIEKCFEAALPKVRADLGKLNQILFLLLDNAVKFTLEGHIEIRAQVRSGMLTCEIRDTGIGICPDDQACVFDEFFQVDELSSTRYRGAGLGLALVRNLLDLLEGELVLDSEAGRGTVVRFSIPVRAH